jgi:hypothetical protein
VGASTHPSLLRQLGMVLVPLIAIACGGVSPQSSSGGAVLRILRPSQGDVLSVRSLAAQTEVAGITHFRLHYYLDGADQGEGDTSITITEVAPGNHRLEVEALREDGRPLQPDLRAGVDFTVQ